MISRLGTMPAKRAFAAVAIRGRPMRSVATQALWAPNARRLEPPRRLAAPQKVHPTGLKTFAIVLGAVLLVCLGAAAAVAFLASSACAPGSYLCTTW